MVKNLGRKLTLIVSLVALSIVSLFVGGFRLGLDLQGGTRLVYSLDLEQIEELAKADGVTVDEMWNDIRSILLDRLDPQGVREPRINLEGQGRFVIELPGSAATLRRGSSLPLQDAISANARTLLLTGPTEDINAFPTRGAKIQIGNELIRYERRIGNQLSGLERNYGDESTATDHAAGATVDLAAADPWRDKIENVGSMDFFMQAEASDLTGAATDLQTETQKARDWCTANPGLKITEYNATLENAPAPLNRLRFFPLISYDGDGNAIVQELADTLQALIVETDEDWRFRGEDVAQVYPSQDDWGSPAVAFVMKDNRVSDFEDFTEEHVKKNMAIVINDEVATMPELNDALSQTSIIRGNYSREEVNDLVTVLRSGSLPLKPKFEGQESVGATLGDTYVRRGFFGIGLGLISVLAFMMIYYRRLGMFAAVSLVLNMVLLTGALAFLQATLTLPGIAGILLTVGMAVDANILIYERIREEALRGRKPLQSARDGFGHALSTIVDANLTTLITGVILYKFGTGPVRGFATTLSIGILTSMFSALVVTRVLVHMQLEKGIERFSMARLIHETKVAFMSKAKPAMTGSIALVVIGLGLFIVVDKNKKLGIDFLGGMTLTAQLAEAHTVEDVRGLLGSEEAIEVREVRNSATDGGYTRFRITAKGSDVEAATADANLGEGNKTALEAFRERVDDSLRSKLAAGPIENLAVNGTSASGLLHLERDHSTDDIAASLVGIGITNATVTDQGDRKVSFSGTVTADTQATDLELRISEDFAGSKDSNGTAYSLASPIGEVYAVGAQVVSELRDNAIFAVLLSLFAAVMYIRVRFAEYSFGFAAVAALTHDVLITLGALAAASYLPFINTEINLPMIAAFLTIIGYSLNDTIVVFDRVRENLPRMKGSLAEIIDRSINQCLARTVLTSVTTLISVTLLLVFNLGTGNVIEGFAFALMIGVIVGTYSSMFIASPVLLFLETRRQASLDDDDPTKQGGQADTAPTV